LSTVAHPFPYTTLFRSKLSRAPHSSSSDDPADIRALPALITLGVPGNPEPEPVSWPLLRAPSLALLQQTVAARVQRRLSDLGYKIGRAHVCTPVTRSDR